MIKAYLDAFANQLAALDDPEIDLVADNFCRLLATASGAKAGEHEEAIRQARLAEAHRYVNLHLADFGADGGKSGGAENLVRQLYLLFEPSGESFARYVTRRRLEECRAALMNPGRSCTDIALAWGFNSMPSFHRNFRQAFGASAGEVHASPDTGRAAPLSRATSGLVAAEAVMRPQEQDQATVACMCGPW
jgi:AraC-like DNA-binding protein